MLPVPVTGWLGSHKAESASMQGARVSVYTPSCAGSAVCEEKRSLLHAAAQEEGWWGGSQVLAGYLAENSSSCPLAGGLGGHPGLSIGIWFWLEVWGGDARESVEGAM